MRTVTDNGAVTATFRVFGGAGKRLQGEAVRRLAGPGSHAGEVRVLGTLVPLVVAAAAADALARCWGPWWALLALPAVLFAGLHALAVVLGTVAAAISRLAGGREGWRWRTWLVALGAWAWWRWHGDDGWCRWVAAAWLAVVAIEAAALALLGWRRLMQVPGRRGVALRMALATLAHLPLVPLAACAGWPWALAWAALAGTAFCWCTLAPNAQGFGPVASRCDGAGVWLTIDDGPDPETTPGLLERLGRAGAKATFFLVGSRVEAHPELAREIVRRGHRVGNHTLTHPAGSFWCAGPWRTRREIVGGGRAIERVTGVRPCWLRAPVGHRNLFTHPVAAEEGMRVVGWTRRGFDGVSRDVGRVVGRLTRRLERGDILVIHDATPVAGAVLDGLLEELRRRGLHTAVPEEDGAAQGPAGTSVIGGGPAGG